MFYEVLKRKKKRKKKRKERQRPVSTRRAREAEAEIEHDRGKRERKKEDAPYASHGRGDVCWGQGEFTALTGKSGFRKKNAAENAYDCAARI